MCEYSLACSRTYFDLRVFRFILCEQYSFSFSLSLLYTRHDMQKIINQKGLYLRQILYFLIWFTTKRQLRWRRKKKKKVSLSVIKRKSNSWSTTFFLFYSKRFFVWYLNTISLHFIECDTAHEVVSCLLCAGNCCIFQTKIILGLPDLMFFAGNLLIYSVGKGLTWITTRGCP